MTTTERDIARFLSELHERVDKAAVLQRELDQKLAQVKAREADIERNYKRREAEMLRKLQDNIRRGCSELRGSSAGYDSEHQGAEAAAEASGPGPAAGIEGEAGRVRRPADPRGRGGGDTGRAHCEAQARGRRSRDSQGIRQPARVRRIINDDVIEVDAGFLKMQVSREDVQEILPEKDAHRRSCPRT